MFESFTAGSLRTLSRAEARARGRGAAVVDLIDLAAGLADEGESRAMALAAEFGLPPDRFLAALEIPSAAPEPVDDDDLRRLPMTVEARAVVVTASSRAKVTRGATVGTEQILAALLGEPSAVVDALQAAGLDVVALLGRAGAADAEAAEPIPLPIEIPPLEIDDPGGEVDLYRVLDASANRAREGLRVVEDYARFALNDSGLTRRLKEARHRLAAAVRGLDPERLLAARDTPNDVGTHIMTASEQARENPRAVLIANFRRTAEALRSLEEYGKLIDHWVAGRFEVLRYDVYTLEKMTLTALAARSTWDDVRLMVLVGGLPTLGDLTWLVEEALHGGAGAIQLREKNLTDREWLTRAREVRLITLKHRARFVVNDRPDLARLAGADAVHLGQDDIAPRDARRVVGPTVALGISTHDPAQLARAIVDGAGYLGVGPTFASRTKEFETFAGLDFVRHAAEVTNLPWFAIGGIDEATIDEAIDAGARRVAVSSAVTRAEFPRRAAQTLRDRLDRAVEADETSPLGASRP